MPFQTHTFFHCSGGKPKEALKSIDLKVVLLFGGSLALAKAPETTGTGSIIADAIVGALGAN